MEKTLLRSVIVGLNEGDTIAVVFRGALQSQTGTFSVLSKKRGRGKGGSWLADLIPVDVREDGSIASREGDSLTIGTPKNDDILNVTVDGAFFGYTTEREVPANYETDAGNSVLLKETFKGLMNAAETRPMVTIEAPGAPEVNGDFTVTDARQLRGRAGQIVLTLVRPDQTDTVELWSYRHSGVVTKFTVVGP